MEFLCCQLLKVGSSRVAVDLTVGQEFWGSIPSHAKQIFSDSFQMGYALFGPD